MNKLTCNGASLSKLKVSDFGSGEDGENPDCVVVELNGAPFAKLTKTIECEASSFPRGRTYGINIRMYNIYTTEFIRREITNKFLTLTQAKQEISWRAKEEE